MCKTCYRIVEDPAWFPLKPALDPRFGIGRCPFRDCKSRSRQHKLGESLFENVSDR